MNHPLPLPSKLLPAALKLTLLLTMMITLLASLILGSCTGIPPGPSLQEDATPAEDSARGDDAAPETDVPETVAPEPGKSPAIAAREKESGLEPPGETEFFTETAPMEGMKMMDTGAPSPRFSSGGESGLQAGYADDNSQFGRFVEFLETYSEGVPHYPMNISQRLSFTIRDARGEPLSGAYISIRTGGEQEKGEAVETGRAFADGTYRFYPSIYPALDGVETFTASISDERGKPLQEFTFSRSGRRSMEIVTETTKSVLEPVPLDILFVLDTTGSMGEEIDRLKATIELIHLNLGAATPRPDLRFGLVLYKDRGDSYITQTVPLTGSLESFRNDLAPVSADGGGDGPEDLQEALRVAMEEIAWRDRGVRLSFVITDAEAHLDYADQTYTYIDGAKRAKEEGIKLYGVGTGGLPLAGEILLRQIAHYTEGKYIFLTYGEGGESTGGSPGSVSHHTGANFATDKLESIIIRFAREELAHYAGKPLEDPEPYLTARKIDAETREETLDKLFTRSLEELAAYSSLLLEKGSPTAVIPIILAAGASEAGGAASPGEMANAEYFTEQLILATGKSEIFQPVERKNLQAILEEQKLLLSGLTGGDTGEAAIKLGRLLNAQYLITGKQFTRDDSFELFLNLLRVETGEVLSITKAVLDRELGL